MRSHSLCLAFCLWAGSYFPAIAGTDAVISQSGPWTTYISEYYLNSNLDSTSYFSGTSSQDYFKIIETGQRPDVFTIHLQRSAGGSGWSPSAEPVRFYQIRREQAGGSTFVSGDLPFTGVPYGLYFSFSDQKNLPTSERSKEFSVSLAWLLTVSSPDFNTQQATTSTWEYVVSHGSENTAGKPRYAAPVFRIDWNNKVVTQDPWTFPDGTNDGIENIPQGSGGENPAWLIDMDVFNPGSADMVFDPPTVDLENIPDTGPLNLPPGMSNIPLLAPSDAVLPDVPTIGLPDGFLASYGSPGMVEVRVGDVTKEVPRLPVVVHPSGTSVSFASSGGAPAAAGSGAAVAVSGPGGTVTGTTTARPPDLPPPPVLNPPNSTPPTSPTVPPAGSVTNYTPGSDPNALSESAAAATNAAASSEGAQLLENSGVTLASDSASATNALTGKLSSFLQVSLPAYSTIATSATFNLPSPLKSVTINLEPASVLRTLWMVPIGLFFIFLTYKLLKV